MITRRRFRDNDARITAKILGGMGLAFMIMSLWLIERRVEQLTTRLEEVITRVDAVIETVRGIVQSDTTRGGTPTNNQQAPEETP